MRTQQDTASTDLLFLCLARDCEHTLPTFFTFLAALQGAGLPCAALIGENGSRDATRALIEGSSVPGVSLVDTSGIATEPQRLLRMAKGRQLLLDLACAQREPPAFVCVADLDNVMAQPPPVEAIRSVMQTLASDKALFAIGASSTPVFYDLIALRARGHEYTTLDDEIQAAKRKPASYFRFHQERIYANQRRVTQDLPLRCVSSFNGLCLYNASDYCRGTYLSAAGASTCEHVVFNESIATSTGKQMLISPELCLQAPADHMPVGFVRFWLDRLRKPKHL